MQWNLPAAQKVLVLEPGRVSLALQVAERYLAVPDAARAAAWYEAARPDPLERRLFRVDLKSGDTIELTAEPGSHTGQLSPAHDRLLVRSTSLELPVRWTVVDGHGGPAHPAG